MEFKGTALSTILLFILSLQCSESQLPDVTYEDISKLTTACKNTFSCDLFKSGNNSEDYNCNCGSVCSYLQTCCYDSPYRHHVPKFPPNARCFYYYDADLYRHYSYLLIWNCDPNLESDKTTVDLCNSEAEELNDPFLKIPVTDPITGISYKNYYCHACNEQYTGENPIPWKLQLKSSDNVNDSSMENLRYDTQYYQWVNDNGQYSELSTHVPQELKRVVYQQHCSESDIIWGCASDWNDSNYFNKCTSYMALTRIRKSDDKYDFSRDLYRNPHCAICNHRSIENIVCEEKIPGTAVYGFRTFFVGWFDLQKKECEDNEVYDDFTKKCRRVFRSKRKVQ